MINLTDKYKTRCGYPVEVLCIDLSGPCPVLFTYINNQKYKNAKTCTLNGKGYYCIIESKLDLIKVTPYDHIKKGDVVWVWDDNQKSNIKYIRLFIEYSDGYIRTSHASVLKFGQVWDNCELYQAKDEK